MSKISDPLLEREVADELFEGGSQYSKWSTIELKKISDLDNQHADKAPRESSKIIMGMGGVEGLIAGLNSNAKTGISADSAAGRRNAHGSNAFPPPEIKGLCELIMENFKDTIN